MKAAAKQHVYNHWSGPTRVLPLELACTTGFDHRLRVILRHSPILSLSSLIKTQDVRLSPRSALVFA